MALDRGGSGKPQGAEALERLLASLGDSSGMQESASGLKGEVYMGSYRAPSVSSQTRKNIIEGGGVPPSRGFHKEDRVLTADEAYLQFFRWNEKKRKDFIAQGILGGLLREGSGMMEASRVWKSMVAEAAMYNAAGSKVTPWDIMSGYVKQSGGADAWVQQGVFEINTVTGERRYVGPGTYLGDGVARQTDTRVDLTDPRTAQAIATRVFQQMMGRAPGKGELTKFASALAKAEQSNPITRTTTTQYNLETGQPITQNTKTSGGLTAEARVMIGENQAKKDPEYGAYQAATTYQGAFEALVYGAPE